NDINIPDLVIKSLEDNTPTSDITNDTLKDKEIEFLNRVHKEQISNEIRERNQRKKLRSQDLFSENNFSNSSYN
ncbi:38537_t:CDS:2, partial [Gigaspora margarita]